MAGKTPRETKFEAAPGFKALYRKFKKLNPEIQKTIEIFNSNKRKIPAEQLPAKMKDHVLRGRLDGIRECHLADDVLLLYTHQDGVIKFLHICTHDDLSGRKEKQLAANLKNLH